jgi:hypothetical protein
VIHEQESPTATGSLATVHRSIEEDVICASWHGGGRKRYRVISSRLQLELMGQRVSRHRTGREKTFGHPRNNEIQIFTAETLQFGRRQLPLLADVASARRRRLLGTLALSCTSFDFLRLGLALGLDVCDRSVRWGRRAQVVVLRKISVLEGQLGLASRGPGARLVINNVASRAPGRSMTAHERTNYRAGKLSLRQAGNVFDVMVVDIGPGTSRNETPSTSICCTDCSNVRTMEQCELAL